MSMKRVILLALAWALCLSAAGCSGTGNASSSATSSQPGASSSSGQDSRPGDASSEHGEPGTGVVLPGEDMPSAAGEEVVFDDGGKLRITYTVNRNSAVYVTSADQLPDYEELAQYDDAFFAEHALVLVTETVNSGSVDVGILSININGSTASVTLAHDAPEGDATADMATWLLWAVVEPGLDCQWTVANPALESETAQY